MTNTAQADLYASLQIGMNIQTSNGTIHKIIEIKVVRTPRRGLLRCAQIRSDVSGWVDLLMHDWRIVHPASQVMPGSHDCVDGLDHSASCSGIETSTYQTSDGWTKMCNHCGFAVVGYGSLGAAEVAYIADQVGALR
jgi:hypothetical protein